MPDPGKRTTNTGDVQRIRLGKSGLSVSPLGVGALTWGDPSIVPRFNLARIGYGLAESKAEQQKAVDSSLAAGVNFIDTAAMYGRGASELRVAELTRGRDIVIATKFPSSFRPWENDFPGDLAASLHRLGRRTIDLYQVHSPFPWLSIPTVMNQMADAVEAGNVKAVGVSNFSADQMREAYAVLAKRNIPLASNQVEYSLLYRKPEIDGVMDACRQLGVTLIAYMPLAMGALTGKYSTGVRPKGIRRFSGVFRGKKFVSMTNVVHRLRDIGEQHSRSPAQVALRWLLEQDGVIPIPGAKNSAQASENAGSLTFRLSESEVESLNRETDSWRPMR